MSIPCGGSVDTLPGAKKIVSVNLVHIKPKPNINKTGSVDSYTNIERILNRHKCSNIVVDHLIVSLQILINVLSFY